MKCKSKNVFWIITCAFYNDASNFAVIVLLCPGTHVFGSFTGLTDLGEKQFILMKNKIKPYLYPWI